VEEKVSRAIPQRINGITHILCGWMIKKTVSGAISQRINEITHDLCGWTIKETVSGAISQRINEITHTVWVDHQRNGQQSHLTAD
jgi:hypothetical protein